MGSVSLRVGAFVQIRQQDFSNPHLVPGVKGGGVGVGVNIDSCINCIMPIVGIHLPFLSDKK